MDVIDKTDDEPLLVSPEAIVEHLGAMDLSSSGLLEIVDAHGERQARAIKRTAREIAWNIVLPAESTNRAAAEQAALAAILPLRKEHQNLTVRTFLGPKDIPAPADFAFDTKIGRAPRRTRVGPSWEIWVVDAPSTKKIQQRRSKYK